MKYHPAILMLIVWASCIAAFYILPFQLEDRVMTLYGFAILALFIATFCFGAVMAGPIRKQSPRRSDLTIDFLNADRILMTAAVIAIIAAVIDARGRNLFDLADAYQMRSDRAGALMIGGDSDSSIFFQIAFLTYPAGYIYLIREIAFRPRPALWKVAVFGLAPIVLASLAMGGRSPLLYAVLLVVYGFNLRKQVFLQKKPEKRAALKSRFDSLRGGARVFKLGVPAKIGIAALGFLSFIYFSQVFFTRADVVGGVDAMFGVAGKSWGVDFNGRFSDLFFTVLGPNGAYLVFVFAWYLLQGLVMSNVIFTGYSGSPMFGTYGIDLMSALMRRLDGQFVADGFSVLLQMNTYGFLPSAFGSLFVDLKFFGLVPCVLWGWLVGKVYQQIRRGRDPRWLIMAPFVTLGIVFSLINTPIGFSNGFITHAWLLVAFFGSKTVAPRRAMAGAIRPSFA